jgi:hypothetical protein
MGMRFGAMGSAAGALGAALVVACSSFDDASFGSSGVGAGGASSAASATGGAPQGGGSPTQSGAGAVAGAGPGPGAGAGGPTGYAAEVLADGPIAYYRLGEASGTTALDSGPGMHHGSYLEKVALGQTGAVAGDTALGLDGMGSRADMGDRFDFAGMASFSIELWVRPAVVRGSYDGIFSKEDDDVKGRQGYFMYLQEGDLGFERRLDGQREDVKAPPLAVGTTVHLAVTFDGATMRLYLDAAQLDEQVVTLPLPDHGRPFVLGARNGGDFGYLAGVVDELALYDKALSPERLSAHVAAAKAP